MKERYPLVVSLSIYVHLPSGSQKISNNRIWTIIVVLNGFFKKSKNQSKEPSVLFQFVHENHRFFDTFWLETTGTNSSLILNSFQRTGNQRFFDSEIFRELELLTGL